MKENIHKTYLGNFTNNIVTVDMNCSELKSLIIKGYLIRQEITYIGVILINTKY